MKIGECKQGTGGEVAGKEKKVVEKNNRESEMGVASVHTHISDSQSSFTVMSPNSSNPSVLLCLVLDLI